MDKDPILTLFWPITFLQSLACNFVCKISEILWWYCIVLYCKDKLTNQSPRVHAIAITRGGRWHVWNSWGLSSPLPARQRGSPYGQPKCPGLHPCVVSCSGQFQRFWSTWTHAKLFPFPFVSHQFHPCHIFLFAHRKPPENIAYIQIRKRFKGCIVWWNYYCTTSLPNRASNKGI